MTKTKIGRNDPCHCGSGQKYKRCCQEKDEAADRAARAAVEAAKPPKPARPAAIDLFRNMIDDEPDELTTASNAIVDMVHAGNLDEAEQAARDFLERFPEVHDGYDRLGMVYEARGDKKQAAHHYRQVIEFVRAHPTHYEPGFETTFLRMIDELDPPPAG
jgi:tetratricopeptide (TPR) repeat protein